MITDMSGWMSPLKWLLEFVNGGNNESAKDAMTAERAVTYAPVYYGVRKISSHVGMLPLNVLMEEDEETTIQRDHHCYKLMRKRPNGYQTPSIWKQQLMTHAIMWGNGRSFIYRKGSRPAELIPLMPDRTLTFLNDGEKFHACKPKRDDRFDLLTDMREKPEEVVVVSDDDVLHIPGFSFDGVEGKSLISMASQSWGLGRSAETRSAKQLAKGYAGGLMLEAPVGALREEEKAREFLENFRKQHDGEDNAGKTALLREGIKANVMSMSNADAQFIEQRKFQRQEAALWLMLEQILGDDTSVSYNSLEQKNLAYLMNCLGPWLTTIEEEANAKLFTESERNKGYYFKFNDGALLRSDKMSAMTFASAGIAATIMTRNEARALFDLNPVDGGDEFMNPAISPTDQQSGDSKEEKGKKDKSDDSDEDETSPLYDNNDTSNRLAIESVVKTMIKNEANTVKSYSKKPNFIVKTTDFYTRWEAKLADKFEEIGLDRDLATIHCEESKAILVDVCNKNTPEHLQKAVEKCVNDWENRAFQLLTEVKS